MILFRLNYLRNVSSFFPVENDPQSITFDRDQERFKTGFNPDYLPAKLRSFFYSLNSRPFIKFLENLTGIDCLIADSYFMGGGFHRINQGGQIELWDEDMNNCVVSAKPEFNRCVIFNTTSNSYHGNPNPINHPDGTPRRSIALYYYTATWDGRKRNHSTQFRARNSSDDKIDWNIKIDEFFSDILPPFFVRNFKRVKRKIGF